jgi:Tfp pilus assembly protein PilN
VVIEAVYDDAGQLVGFAKVTRDVSERHRQEQELLQAKELAEQYSQEMAKLSQFLDSVIANIPASVIVQDLESQRILLANQSRAPVWRARAQHDRPVARRMLGTGRCRLSGAAAGARCPQPQRACR